MAIDRDDALRKAEKLLRQGRLDGAIAEYEQVVDAYPDDIATASALGDLYGRAGKAPQAVAQFMRLGDHFLKEGVQAKAAASYRKVLKLDPASRGRAPPAGRGLRPAGAAGRRQDAPPGGDREAQGARRPGRRRHARHPPRRARPQRLRGPAPGGEDPRPHRQGGHRGPDVAGAGARHAQADERGRGAARGSGQARSRAPPRCRCAWPRPRSPATRWHAPSASCPTRAADKDPELLLTGGKILLKLDNLDAARDHLVRFLAAAPKAVEEVATLGEHLASPNARYAIVDLLVDHAAASGDFGKAARRLQGFLEKAPRHLAALLRLVEVCVDGDLDAALTAAQQELAEAYLDAGEAEKARVIAEDLLLRNPRSSTHKDRLRRVLVTLGEKDPDGIIAERLSMLDEDAFASEDSAPRQPVAAAAAAGGRRAAARGRREPRRRRVPADQRDHGRYAGGPARDGCGRRGRRVRGQRCRRLERRAAVTATPIPSPNPRPSPRSSPMRSPPTAAGSSTPCSPACAARPCRTPRRCRRAITRRATSASARPTRPRRCSRKPPTRSRRRRATRATGSARRSRWDASTGSTACCTEAVEWLDIASEAPAPKIDEHRSALYELADALETTGEHTRALSVLLDLVAEQSDYRDARARIERLSRVKA